MVIFCYKHRKNYLFDKNDNLIYDRYTGNKKDYTKKI